MFKCLSEHRAKFLQRRYILVQKYTFKINALNQQYCLIVTILNNQISFEHLNSIIGTKNEKPD
jgi:hypothetical protein